MSKLSAPLPPAPVIMTCFGHCGIGLGAESYRRLLLDVGANPLKPTIKTSKDESKVLKRYGSTILRFPPTYTSGEIPLIPRALLVDLDPRASNLILQSYPDLFALREKHVIYGAGGAARNWAEGRTRFDKEMKTKMDIKKQLAALSPEPVRGYTVPFAMGGGTGSSFASSFIEFIKQDSKDPTTIATFGLLPEFGWDPVIFESAVINIIMNLEYQIKYSDCSVLFSNKILRQVSHQNEKKIQKIPSIIDDLPKEHEVGWKDYKGMNLIAANAISMFIASFARETEWDMSNYRTWLTTKRPKFAIPWVIPVIPEEDQWGKELLGGKNHTMEGIISKIGKKEDAILFDIDEADIRNNGGNRDSCCVLVKVRGEFDVKERESIKQIIKDRFDIQESRMIFVKIPIMEGEPSNVTILVNTKAIGPKILEMATEAEESWNSYKDEYGKWGLSTEEFKQGLMDVVHQFS
ncbi:MAG: cell division protein FtsZ [Nitrosopumilus sp.]|uniref:cell division protein FtsZ n=1 Tax=Nitrosopumilus sp. TaxID=2024843 RepID=UPI00292D8576|nr:cell division protein FtsZ [Nitrosopumilus sp.]